MNKFFLITYRHEPRSSQLRHISVLYKVVFFCSFSASIVGDFSDCSDVVSEIIAMLLTLLVRLTFECNDVDNCDCGCGGGGCLLIIILLLLLLLSTACTCTPLPKKREDESTIGACLFFK